MKYLLSTGSFTERPEYYIIDLIRLNLQILPDEIPNSGFGFNYVITDTKKDELKNEVKSRLEVLVSRVVRRVGDSYKITISSIDLLDNSEGRFKVVIDVNGVSDELVVSL